MGILERTYAPEVGPAVDEALISADSHVIEPEGLWKENLPRRSETALPTWGEPGGTTLPAE